MEVKVSKNHTAPLRVSNKDNIHQVVTDFAVEHSISEANKLKLLNMVIRNIESYQ